MKRWNIFGNLAFRGIKVIDKKEIELLMDKAELEIKKTLNKYGLSIGTYEDKDKITLCHVQWHDNGDCSLFERECDL